MKKSLLLLAGLAAAAGSAAAQVPATPAPPAMAAPAAGRPSPDQQADRRAQYLTKELGLSPDQQARLMPILLAQRQDMQAMRAQVSTGGRRRGMGQDLKASQAKFNEQIKGVFTPEQFTKFTQMQEEQRDKMRERRQNGGPLPAPAN
ncbi:hypothetical protein [Hymenobacter terricola]|uniref:hypothetical protein n=1 Tax=Hymenobacter terricola TaxID=2819236 RepID=UPI001B304E08|nr:hypothetical protein [Hymenobacter terricola]